MIQSWTLRSTLFIIFFVTAFVACRSTVEQPSDLRSEMRNAYQVTSELYNYVWSETFYEARSERHIERLLNQLSSNFHRVEDNTPVQLFEPGFRTILRVHQEMLEDASKRFTEGQKDYANWRLRGIAGSCISCHSRLHTPVDFVGQVAPLSSASPEALLARAEFLFATRQFDAASAELEKILETAPYNSAVQDTSIKLWLVIQVRNKQTFQHAAEELVRLRDSRQNILLREAGEVWIADLKQLQAARPAMTIEEAEKLLSKLQAEGTIQEDDRHLVKSMLASAYLHQLLQQNLSPSDRRRATFLLAKAYYHIQLQTFDAYQQLYLELTIREYPHTAEAREAFELYENRFEFLSTGSGGMNIEPDDEQKLNELRRLAYPVDPPILTDAVAPAV